MLAAELMLSKLFLSFGINIPSSKQNEFVDSLSSTAYDMTIHIQIMAKSQK